MQTFQNGKLVPVGSNQHSGCEGNCSGIFPNHSSRCSWGRLPLWWPGWTISSLSPTQKSFTSFIEAVMYVFARPVSIITQIMKYLYIYPFLPFIIQVIILLMIHVYTFSLRVKPQPTCAQSTSSPERRNLGREFLVD